MARGQKKIVPKKDASKVMPAAEDTTVIGSSKKEEKFDSVPQWDRLIATEK
jgi:hypothetical protein